MANSRVGTEEIQDELTASRSAKKCSKTQKDGGMSKGHGQPERAPSGQS